MQVIHIAFRIQNIDTSMKFYCDLLGFELTRTFEKGDMTSYFLTDENNFSLQLTIADNKSEIGQHGLDHIAIEVSDLETVLEQVRNHSGCEVIRGPVEATEMNMTLAFVTDPDGYRLELIEFK